VFKKFSSSLMIFAVVISLIVLSETESTALDCGGCGQPTCEWYLENGGWAYGSYEAAENDIDDDGILNEDDECEDTPVGETVDPSNGCSIKQLVPCEGPRESSKSWRNNGKYVSALAKVLKRFVSQGLITKKEIRAFMKGKASSGCGKYAFTNTALYSTTMPQNNDETDIYYPVPVNNVRASRKFPVALFLQGGRVSKNYYSKFAEELAKYGFIVVVPNHDADFILTDPDYPGIEITFKGFFPENQQIPDVLDFMSAENNNATSPLYGIVNNEILVLTGHSFGSAVIIDAIQETCEFPLCRPEGSSFTLPEEVKAVALTGINTIPFGNPFDTENRPTDNPVPMAIINGDLDENAEYHDTKDSYKLIENPPKALVFVKGANHYGLCDVNNPGNPNFPAEPQNDGTPTPQENPPTLDQDISIETNARWTALFLRAHALNDPAAMEYISTTGRLLDPNVEVRYGDEQLDYEVLLAQASEIDENICEYTQTLFGDIDETSGVTVDRVRPGVSSTSPNSV